jgi:hypothetical protein
MTRILYYYNKTYIIAVSQNALTYRNCEWTALTDLHKRLDKVLEIHKNYEDEICTIP